MIGTTLPEMIMQLFAPKDFSHRFVDHSGGGKMPPMWGREIAQNPKTLQGRLEIEQQVREESDEYRRWLEGRELGGDLGVRYGHFDGEEENDTEPGGDSEFGSKLKPQQGVGALLPRIHPRPIKGFYFNGKDYVRSFEELEAESSTQPLVDMIIHLLTSRSQ